eukprot:10947413-Heterocapsa_arctica.AAC.1
MRPRATHPVPLHQAAHQQRPASRPARASPHQVGGQTAAATPAKAQLGESRTHPGPSTRPSAQPDPGGT